MSDLLFSAEIDSGKFRDGLDRLRSLVREKHNEMVRDWANAGDRWEGIDRVRNDRTAKYWSTSLGEGLERMKRSAADGHGAMRTEYERTGESHSRFIKHLGKHLIADALGIREAIKYMKEYAAETGVGAGQVEDLSRAWKDFRNSIGRDITSGEAGSMFASVLRGVGAAREEAASGLAFLIRGAIRTEGSTADADEAAKKLEEVSKETRSYAINLELANRQLTRMKELEGDTIGAVRLRARERYEQSVRAINAEEGLSGSQRSQRVDAAAQIRDREIAKAVGEQEDKRVNARGEMAKVRADRLRDEVKAGEEREKDAARDREELDRQREAWRIDIERMRVDEVRARGDERATRVAQLRLELEEKMARLEASKLPEQEKRGLRRSILESLQAQLTLAEEEKGPKKTKRSDDIAGSIDPGLGGGSLLYQVFGGNGSSRKADELVQEAKTHTGLLRELVAKFAADIATFSA